RGRSWQVSDAPTDGPGPGVPVEKAEQSSSRILIPMSERMFNCSRVPVLIALAVGALGGWVAASGRLDVLLKAGAQPQEARPSDPPGSCSGCCEGEEGQDALLARAGAPQDAKGDRQSADTNGKKPNILVIMGDDIGWFNPSCYHQGVMGYQTPNIDRIAKE